MKGCDGFFESDDTGPSLIDIGVLGNLRELFRKARYKAASIDAANFKRNYSPAGFSYILQEPVRMFLALHPADDAPSPAPMGNSKGYSLGAILRDPVIVMPIHLAQVSSWPRKHAASRDS